MAENTPEEPENDLPQPSPGSEGVSDPGEETFVDTVFGDAAPEPTGLVTRPTLKNTFAPWHHPVKQIVRDYQWAALTRRLMERERPADQRDTLRYFTLPGSDLLDVRLLAETLHPIGAKVEYFGFDVGYRGITVGEQAVEQQGVYFATESALRQAGRITDNSEILNDRLEDIAQTGTQAANRLRQKPVFDVINIDACDHLGFVPEGRAKSVFDALESLLAHQLPATQSWLLFVTTRANPSQLGPPATKLQGAIHSNLDLHKDQFGEALVACIGGQVQTIAADLAANWSTQNINFLKLFCIGLGKYLLQFYHGQHNLPADVELASAFAYKVHHTEPDMLSLAFRITPHGLRVQPPTAGAASVTAALELKKAVGVTEKASRLWDLDSAIAADPDVRKDAVDGTARLLKSADYDLPSWKAWLGGLTLRPMQLDEISV